MANIMLDIETLGTVITQIGAVYFDWTGKTGETFLVNINIKSCLDKGLEIRYRELKFWLENKNRITWDKNTIPLTYAMEKLADFCSINKKTCIWSHYYDLEILDIACQKLGKSSHFTILDGKISELCYFYRDSKEKRMMWIQKHIMHWTIAYTK